MKDLHSVWLFVFLIFISTKDVSNILIFVMMEVNDATMYIYKRGHNMNDFETASYIYLDQVTQSIPNSQTCTNVTRAAIQGTKNIFP